MKVGKKIANSLYTIAFLKYNLMNYRFTADLHDVLFSAQGVIEIGFLEKFIVYS